MSAWSQRQRVILLEPSLRLVICEDPGKFGIIVPDVVQLPSATCRRSRLEYLRLSPPKRHCRAPRNLPLVPPLRPTRRPPSPAVDRRSLQSGRASRAASGPKTAAPRKSEYYGNAEFLERQWRLLDLVPRRLLVLTLLLLAGPASSPGLEAAYVWMLERAAAGSQVLAAFDIAAKGSLACWFSSLTLLAASVTALLVYTVRRHRTDDYQGRYRVWLWAAGCWFLLATDQAASLREGFRDVMVGWTGTPMFARRHLLVGGGLRPGVRGDRLAAAAGHAAEPAFVAALAAAAIAYGLALASHLGWTPIGTAAGEVMFRTGSEMAGHLMLLAAMGFTPAMSCSTPKGSCPIPSRGRPKSRTRTRRRRREGSGEGDFAGRQPLAGDRSAARRSAAGVSASCAATGRRARGQACHHARPQSISGQSQADQGRTQGAERASAPRAAGTGRAEVVSGRGQRKLSGKSDQR